MTINIFKSKSKQKELSVVINNTLMRYLPRLFRVHRELLNKANPETHRLKCSTQELAQATGYGLTGVKNILEDLSMLNFIEYQKRANRWQIEVLVY